MTSPRNVALIRPVSDSLPRCVLTHLPRTPIDVALARRQHVAYVNALARCGAHVVTLHEMDEYPDAVFVEDTVVVLDEVAVICRMGARERRGEAVSVALALEPHRRLVRMTRPATLDGGDVLHIGTTLFVGQGERSNPPGHQQLQAAVDRYGYRVVSVPVEGCLHLKSACAYLGQDTVLANSNWVDCSVFAGYEVIEIPHDEPRAANVLAINETVLVAAAFPRTLTLIAKRGFETKSIEVSELAKAEAGLSCMSVIFFDEGAEDLRDLG